MVARSDGGSFPFGRFADRFDTGFSAITVHICTVLVVGERRQQRKRTALAVLFLPSTLLTLA